MEMPLHAQIAMYCGQPRKMRTLGCAALTFRSLAAVVVVAAQNTALNTYEFVIQEP